MTYRWCKLDAPNYGRSFVIDSGGPPRLETGNMLVALNG